MPDEEREQNETADPYSKRVNLASSNLTEI
jgi:hypothetical protein